MKFLFMILAVIMSVQMSQLSYGMRIKDIASIDGVRDNQLVGYGLVVGLNGTGDKTNQAPFTNQSFKSMLSQFGVQLPRNINLQLKNVAAVAISATLPPFTRPGQKIDITVSSIGNATSLRGGSLLMAPLRGADGRVYAMSQGSVIVSGIGAQGADGSKVTVNIPSAGRVPNGAIVERSVKSPFLKRGNVIFQLHRPDFTTAKRVVDTINFSQRRTLARALDAGQIEVTLARPSSKFRKKSMSSIINMLSTIENLTLTPADAPAKIVVNSRTGTVVIGQHVTVRPAAVSHGSLSVIIAEQPFASQPGPFSRGKTKVLPSSNITISQKQSRAFVFSPGASLNDIVKAINRVGAAPGDLVAILEALKSAGALQAQLVVI